MGLSPNIQLINFIILSFEQKFKSDFKGKSKTLKRKMKNEKNLKTIGCDYNNMK